MNEPDNHQAAIGGTMALIRQLAEGRFYGALTLKFESGRITTIKKEQTIKPSDLSEQPRSERATAETK